MKSPYLAIVALVGITTTPNTSFALGGDEFYQFCKSSDPVKRASGTFYSIGIADRNLIKNQGDPDAGPFCIPLDTAREKIFEVACKNFEVNTDWLELNATWGIQQNFKNFFPCKRQA